MMKIIQCNYVTVFTFIRFFVKRQKEKGSWNFSRERPRQEKGVQETPKGCSIPKFLSKLVIIFTVTLFEFNKNFCLFIYIFRQETNDALSSCTKSTSLEGRQITIRPLVPSISTQKFIGRVGVVFGFQGIGWG